MRVVTIPKKIAQDDDLVVIPRKEYEVLVRSRNVREFKPTLAQKKSLRSAEANLRKKKTLGYNELIKRLGFTS